MEYLPVDTFTRHRVNEFLRKRWFSTEMIIRRRRIDLSDSDGISVWEKGEIV